MSDVSAVVLTIGEPTKNRAINSVNRQTLAPKEVICVENVTPFHKALNQGASKVKTDFFVQVDADMILDDTCFEALRNCMQENIGITATHLRDPVIGRMSSIKMYRKECFEKVRFRNTISPDTDFVNEISKYGWQLLHVLNFDNKDRSLWHTYGEHRPDYTPLYMFSKTVLVGRRYVYRKDLAGLRWHISRLAESNHKLAYIGQIAIAYGTLSNKKEDHLKPYSTSEDYRFLDQFLSQQGKYNGNIASILPTFMMNSKAVYKRFYRLGTELRSSGASKVFKKCLDNLNKSNDICSLIAKVGLCRGLFAENYVEGMVANEYQEFSKRLLNFDFNFIVKDKLRCIASKVYRSLKL